MFATVATAVLLSAGLLALPGRPTPSSLRFDHLSIADGLSGYTITALLRDRTGFLWVGTQRGLCRYDGSRFRIFSRAGGHLADDDVTSLAVDPNDSEVFWIGTRTGGLFRFDSRTETFEHLPVKEAEGGCGSISVAHFDRNGTLWVGTTNAGLCRLDRSERPILIPAGKSDLSGRHVHAITEPASRPGELWLGTDGGIFILDSTTGRARRFESAAGSPPAVTAITAWGESIWYGTASDGLHRIEARGAAFVDSRIPVASALEHVSSLVPSRQFPNLLWVGTRGKGLFSLDAAKLELRRYGHDPEDVSSLSRDDVHTIYEDDAKLLWVGTVVGLNKAPLVGKRFVPRFVGGESSRDSQGNSVLALYVAPSDPETVWVSVLRQGVFRYSRPRDELFPVPLHPEPLDLIFSFLEDSKGRFWMAGGYPFVFHFDRQTGRTTGYRISDREDFLVHQLVELNHLPGTFWLATRDEGVLEFDPDSLEVVARFGARGPPSSRLSSHYAWSLHESKSSPGILWVATRGGGVNRIDVKSRSVTQAQEKAGQDCRVGTEIISIASTGDGKLWLGTYGSGLIEFDVARGACRSYTMEDGLAYSDVAAILVDGQERLWLTTSNGMSLLDPGSGTLSTFTTEDGLQSNIFHYNVAFRGPGGELFVGGAKGFNEIDPSSVPINASDPRVVLTSFLVRGVPYPLVREKSGYGSVTLEHTENDLAFEFAALDLWQPPKNRFKVMLAGAEEEWRPIVGKAETRYPALAPGKFSFNVLGSNNDGHWSSKPAVLAIEIKPPYWQRWWFRVLAVIGVLGLVAAAYRYRIRQLLAVEGARRRIADDLHDDLGSKFSNIALQLDLHARDSGLSDASRNRLGELSKMARDAVDDLRETVWMVDSANDDVRSLVARMEQLCSQISASRELDFQRTEELPERVVSMTWRRHVFLAFKEAIHNAVQHSAGKHLDVRVSVEGDSLCWIVADDGVGIGNGGSDHGGRGIGSMRRRAETLRGELEVRSERGSGTELRFRAPIP